MTPKSIAIMQGAEAGDRCKPFAVERCVKRNGAKLSDADHIELGQLMTRLELRLGETGRAA